ncbi:MAG: DUF3134 family protein [Cyanobacteria bacterium P01_G01_bin.38]
MVTLYNPSLHEEPRDQPVQPILRERQESILGWLERTGRLIPYEIDESQSQLQGQIVSEDWDDGSNIAKHNPEAVEENTDTER